SPFAFANVEVTSPELPQPTGALAAGAGALAEPVLPVRPLATTAAAVDPLGAGVGVEGGDVGEAALFVVLELDALAAAHLGQFLDLEDQGLDVVPDGGDVVAGDAQGDEHLAVQHLFAAALLRQQVVLRGDEAVAGPGRDQQLAARLVGQEVDDAGALVEVDHQPHRLAVAAAGGQLVGADGEDAAVRSGQQQLVGRIGGHEEGEAVAFLELQLGRIVDLALLGANPAAF